MKVKLLKSMGSYSHGAIMEVSDERAELMIGNHLAEHVKPKESDPNEPALGANGFVVPNKMVKRQAVKTK